MRCPKLVNFKVQYKRKYSRVSLRVCVVLFWWPIKHWDRLTMQQHTRKIKLSCVLQEKCYLWAWSYNQYAIPGTWHIYINIYWYISSKIKWLLKVNTYIICQKQLAWSIKKQHFSFMFDKCYVRCGSMSLNVRANKPIVICDPSHLLQHIEIYDTQYNENIYYIMCMARWPGAGIDLPYTVNRNRDANNTYSICQPYCSFHNSHYDYCCCGAKSMQKRRRTLHFFQA